MTVKPTNCAVCGSLIAQKPVGRPRRYCESCGPEVFRAQKDVWERIYRRKGSPTTPRSLKSNPIQPERG